MQARTNSDVLWKQVLKELDQLAEQGWDITFVSANSPLLLKALRDLQRERPGKIFIII